MDDFPRYSCIFHTRAAVVECLLIMCSLHGYMDNKWKNRLASTICSQVILYVVVRSYLNPEDGGTGVSEALFLLLGAPLLALHPCFFCNRKWLKHHSITLWQVFKVRSHKRWTDTS